MNKYQFSSKTESGLGKVFYYCYAEDRFETYLNSRNIKYKKNWENQGKNLFNELQQKLDNIKFYIEQSDIKNMLWGKEILKIIDGGDKK